MTALALQVNAQSTNSILYLIKPVFETSTLGARITVDERSELYSMLTEGCTKVLKTTVKSVQPSELDEVKGEKADFLIWNLKHYHFLFDDDEHQACLKATLYRFSASNNYSFPIFAATPPTVIGDDSYGDLAPFREGIDAYFKALRRYLKIHITGDSLIEKTSAEDILKNDPLHDAASKVFVLVSPLNDSTVGSEPMDYEIFHLPGMVAHFVGNLLQKSPVVIDENTLALFRTQSMAAKVARVDLHNHGNGDNVLDFTLYHSPDLDNPVFRITVKDPLKKGWSKNEDFQEGLELIFKHIGQQREFVTYAGNK